jgi:hypothetical protein
MSNGSVAIFWLISQVTLSFGCVLIWDDELAWLRISLLHDRYFMAAMVEKLIRTLKLDFCVSGVRTSRPQQHGVVGGWKMFRGLNEANYCARGRVHSA